MAWKFVLAALVVAVASGAYIVGNMPVPEGFEDPWMLRVMCSCLKVFKMFMDFKENFYTYEDMVIASQKSSVKDPPIESLHVKVRDIMIDRVPVSVYTPEGLPTKDNPGIVVYHGGGWVHQAAVPHAYCQKLAKEVGAIVMSVDYRLAPVHPYPTPLNDCITATKYFIENAEEFGVDASRVAVAGDSTGGNLAAAVALRLRDLKLDPQPKLQVLIYPALQAIDFNSPSYQVYSSHPSLSKREMVRYWLLYATGTTKYLDECITNHHTTGFTKKEISKNQLNHDKILKDYDSSGYVPVKDNNFGNATIWLDLQHIFTDPYFAPLMSKDLKGLPDTLLVTVEHDVLRDDGVWYASYLREAGVRVTHTHYRAGFHALLSFVMDQKNNREAMANVYSGIRERL